MPVIERTRENDDITPAPAFGPTTDLQATRNEVRNHISSGLSRLDNGVSSMGNSREYNKSVRQIGGE